MKMSPRAGFTIMETTLFLAITGLLILMVATGTGVALNTQRYQDAVETFKSQVQQQYSELASVQNSRNDATEKLACGPNARPTPTADDADAMNRGQSSCMIAGKYMRLEGDMVTTYNVIAYKNAIDVPSTALDIQAMSGAYFTYNIDTTPVLDTRIEWGATLAWPRVAGTEEIADTSTRTTALLFLRSPNSGQVYTFSADKIFPKGSLSDANIKEMIRTTASPVNRLMGQQPRVICIDSTGMVTTGNRALYINAEATSPSSIETVTNDLLKTKVPTGSEATEC